jgi:alkylhydroperoxidase family enzyme
LLRSKFFSSEQVEAMLRDYRNAGLTPAEVGMCAFAEKITLNAYKVTESDIAGLRENGFSDEEILDIALAASFRAMFSKVLDAVGAEPDIEYLGLGPEFARALTVGRPIGGDAHLP